jgi:hypothetical protein
VNLDPRRLLDVALLRLRSTRAALPADIRRLAAVGVVVGLLCATRLGRVLGSLLYGVSYKDPPTFAAVALLYWLQQCSRVTYPHATPRVAIQCAHFARTKPV